MKNKYNIIAIFIMVTGIVLSFIWGYTKGYTNEMSSFLVATEYFLSGFLITIILVIILLVLLGVLNKKLTYMQENSKVSSRLKKMENELRINAQFLNSGEWTCSECGKINQNYVENCECGKQKN